MNCSRQRLLEAFTAALEAVDPVSVARKAASDWDDGSAVAVVAIGKAACGLYEGVYQAIGERIEEALVITAESYLRDIPNDPEVCLGSHPVPDVGSLSAGARLIEFLVAQRSKRRILVLISGGASAMVESLREGLTLEDLERVNQWLLSSGLGIGDMNSVRKGLSRIKGGGLLDFLPHTDVQVFLISDVPGDVLGSIGSGLLTDERELISKLAQLDLPQWLLAMLPGTEEMHSRPEIQQALIATNGIALEAAAALLQEEGVNVIRHGLLEGDAAERGEEIGRFLNNAESGYHLWGGETTVRLPAAPGRGGRNQHLALHLARQISGQPGEICVVAASTDGVDGASQDAGAMVDTRTLEEGEAIGLDADAFLARADSNSYFNEIGALVHTGATGTNVMDLVIACKLKLPV